MNDRHWHLGFAPITESEIALALRNEAEELAFDERRRHEPIPTLSDYEPGETEIIEEDPVTPFDLNQWTTAAHYARLDFFDALHTKNWDQIRAYWDEIKTEVYAKAFAKRFEVWCEKGCPFDKETKE